MATACNLSSKLIPSILLTSIALDSVLHIEHAMADCGKLRTVKYFTAYFKVKRRSSVYIEGRECWSAEGRREDGGEREGID